MRIFCFGSDYYPTDGGLATHTKEWLTALAEERGIKVRATIFKNKEPRIEKVGGVIELTALSGTGFFYMGYRIFRDIWNYRHYDVIHAFNLFPIGFWVVFWSKIFGKKSVLSFYGQDAIDKRTSPKVLWLQKWSMNHATWVITITEFPKQKVVERYGIAPEKIHVIHPMLPKFKREATQEDVRKKLGIAPTDFVVLSVSRLVERKGVEYLIEAVSQIPDPTVKLVIIGGGPEKAKYVELVSRLNLKNRVLFAGRVPSLPPYYAAGNISALVSYIIEEKGDFEGLGFVLLEAQSFGLPVIATRSGGIPEALEEGKTGLIVPERDVKAIAAAILKLRNDPALYEMMKKNTAGFLEREFGKGNTVGKYLRLISMEMPATKSFLIRKKCVIISSNIRAFRLH